VVLLGACSEITWTYLLALEPPSCVGVPSESFTTQSKLCLGGKLNACPAIDQLISEQALETLGSKSPRNEHDGLKLKKTTRRTEPKTLQNQLQPPEKRWLWDGCDCKSKLPVSPSALRWAPPARPSKGIEQRRPTKRAGVPVFTNLLLSPHQPSTPPQASDYLSIASSPDTSPSCHS
jgi:hypothetical protein